MIDDQLVGPAKTPATNVKTNASFVPAQTRKLNAGLTEIRKQWSSGHRRTARKICDKLIAEHPENGELMQLNGLILYETGQTDKAIRSLESACNSAETRPAYFTDLAAILSNSGYGDQARNVLLAAQKRYPVEAKVHLQLGLLEARLAGVHRAVQHLKHAISLAPKDWNTWNAMGAVLLSLDDIQAAMQHFGNAFALAQQNGETRALNDIQISLGECHKELGNFEEAQKIFENVLKAEPRNIRAWHCLSLISKIPQNHPTQSAMQQVYSSGRHQNLPAKDREMFLFSIGKTEMDGNNYGSAMKALDEANRIKRESITYSPTAIENMLDDMQLAFPAERFAQLAPVGNQDDEPQHVFIVGMPRSGTTLIEQILSSHPEIFGAGELDVMARHHHGLIEHRSKSSTNHERLEKYDDEFVHLIGQAYRKETLARISRIAANNASSDKTRRIIDKLPANFVRAGMIALMLPNTRIIHCRRNPVATCFSIYNRRFGGIQNFAYDQKELGHYYNTYMKFMHHWRQVLPADRFIEVDYENVIDDLGTEARRLIDFVGLEWDDACMEFHKTKRQIRTHSAMQVRNPIYRDGLKNWEPYANYLQPLLDTLGLDKSGLPLNS
ncbi:sulfotransferase family protein [Thalassospira sp. HJ]|uniref:tetratricopeptide repeat-containing sulfotransferase family protein n=1 Tax=Thalassospira sp. HJ TaxID=1616823 RepID=UPI0006970605|nr:sulfotransferase family protein [Thalassospira sp. HJ]